MALECAADHHSFALDDGVWSELQVAEHGDGIATHSAVYVGIAEDSDGYIADRPGHPCIAKNGGDSITHFSLARGRAEDGYDGVRDLVCRQMRISPDANDPAAVHVVSIKVIRF